MAVDDSSDSFRVTMIGGMKGDSFLLESPTGENMVIDTGDRYDNGTTVRAVLNERDITQIDDLAATHDDADHIGGHATIVKAFGPDRIGNVHSPKMGSGEENDTRTARRWRNALAEREMKENELEEGSSVDLGSVEVDIHNPSPDVAASNEDENKKRNENSLVIHATYGEQSALFTGDIRPKATQHLVDEYADQLTNVEILVGPHHGGENQAWEALVETCEPDSVFFSYDENNGDDHPHNTTLDQTRDAAPDADIYTKPLHSTTTATLDGHGQTTVVSATDRAPTPTDDIKLAKYYNPDIEQFDLEAGIPTTDLSDETPTEVFENDNVVDSEPVQYLYSRLDALDPQTEVAEQRIETLDELVDTADPRTEGYKAQLDLFDEQVDQLEADTEIRTEQSEETAPDTTKRLSEQTTTTVPSTATDEQQTTIEELTSEIKALEEQLEAATAASDTRHERLDRREERLTDREEWVNRREEQVDKREQQVAKREERLEEREERVDKREERLDEREKRLNERDERSNEWTGPAPTRDDHRQERDVESETESNKPDAVASTDGTTTEPIDQDSEADSKWLDTDPPENIPAWMEETDPRHRNEREDGRNRTTENDQDRTDDDSTPGGDSRGW